MSALLMKSSAPESLHQGCIICGKTSQRLDMTTNHAQTPTQPTRTDRQRNSKVFTVLCTRLNIKLEITSWNLDLEPLPFCSPCTNNAIDIMLLLENIDVLQLKIRNLVENVQKKVILSNQNTVLDGLDGGNENVDPLAIVIDERTRNFQTSVMHEVEFEIFKNLDDSFNVEIKRSKTDNKEDHKSGLLNPVVMVQKLAEDGPSDKSNVNEISINKQSREAKSHPTKKGRKKKDEQVHVEVTIKEELISDVEWYPDASEASSQDEADEDIKTIKPPRPNRNRKRKNLTSTEPAETLTSDTAQPKRSKKTFFFKTTKDGNLVHGNFLVLVLDQGFQCVECGHVLKCRENMTQHVKVKHKGESVVCNICGKSFRRIKRLRNHIMGFHEGTIKCPICERPLAGTDNMKSHMWSHKNEEEKRADIETGVVKPKPSKFWKRWKVKDHQCGICGKFYDKYSLKQHEAKHFLIPSVTPFECQTCGKGFQTSEFLKSHERIHLPDRMKVQCQICLKRFGSKHLLTLHQVVHTGEKPFECSMCDKKYARATALKHHQVTHTAEKPYSCTFCARTFSWRNTLRRHNQICNATNTSQNTRSKVTIITDNNQHHETSEEHQLDVNSLFDNTFNRLSTSYQF